MVSYSIHVPKDRGAHSDNQIFSGGYEETWWGNGQLTHAVWGAFPIDVFTLGLLMAV